MLAGILLNTQGHLIVGDEIASISGSRPTSSIAWSRWPMTG
jgi:hypothetical protein